MSDKMRRFLDKKKPIQRKDIPIMQEVVQEKPIQNLINEAVQIKNIDKENIYNYIQHPINTTYVLQSYADEHMEQDRTMWFSRTMGTGNRVVVIFYSGLEEIADLIVEMCDSLNWPFISGIQEDTDKITFEIFVR
jgi:hypothetical protein